MLRIYYADVSGLDPAGDYALSEYRRARLASVRQDASRRCGIGAELLLNRAIIDWRSDFPLPLDIVTLEHGKPALRGGEIYIGLSHSGTYAAAAVCDEDFGLDIQRNMPPNIALARRFFAADEQEYIACAADAGLAFTEIWCRKESYIKALGTGLGTGQNSFSVLDMPWLWYGEDGIYHFAVCSRSGVYLQPEKFEKKELL